MQSNNAKADAHRIALQYIEDCKQGATPALLRHARKIMAPGARTEAEARRVQS